jgi:hypothetical protein
MSACKPAAASSCACLKSRHAGGADLMCAARGRSGWPSFQADRLRRERVLTEARKREVCT